MAAIYFFDPEEEVRITVKNGFIVGRADGCDLVIKDQSVSSKHAKIVMSRGKTHIIDLKSFNSTFVNGEELMPEKERELKNSDVVHIGDKVFYYNSDEGNLNYLDMPSFTGTINGLSEKTGQKILHNFEPVLDLSTGAKKGVSLRELREKKDRIESKKREIEKLQKLIAQREEKLQVKSAKNKELDEFLNYLKAKNYQTEDEIKKTIESVNQVSTRILKEMEETRELVKELKAKYLGFEKEVKNNKLIVAELESDIEIVNGRDAMAIEISLLSEEIENLSKVDYQANIALLEEEIEQEEGAMKKAQEGYAESRFGKKLGPGINKKVS